MREAIEEQSTETSKLCSTATSVAEDPTALQSAPAGWSRKALGSLARIRRGASPRPIDNPLWFADDGPGWVRISDVTKAAGKLRTTEQRLSLAGVQRSVPVCPGNVLMSICATIGEPVVVEMDACIHDGFVVFDRFQDQLHQQFLLHLLRSLTPLFRAQGQTGTQANLNADLVRMYEVQIPNRLCEQRHIASVLDTIDEAIDRTEAVIDKLRNVREGLLRDLLTRGLNEDGSIRNATTHAEQFQNSPLGLIPKVWGVGVLSDLVSPRRPIVYGILMPGRGFEGGVPVIKVKDIKNGRIDTGDLLLTDPRIDEVYRRSRVRENDLLFSIRGTVGRMAFVPANLDAANITQDTARISLNDCNPLFVARWLEMPVPTRFIETHTIGVAVRGINLRDVRRIPVVIPRRDEQDRIAELLSILDNQLRHEANVSNTLSNIRSGLASDVLTGRVRVSEGIV